MARVPAAQLCEWRRLRAGLLLPYHLGRLTTYALLGGLAASSVAVLGRLPWFTRLSAVLMAAAAALFLFEALARMAAVGRRLPGVHPAWSRLIARLARRISRNRAMGGYLLGLTLGFLPCSFLYGAIFAAATGGDWLRGAAAMLCFGLGTVPMLIVVGACRPYRPAPLAPGRDRDDAATDDVERRDVAWRCMDAAYVSGSCWVRGVEDSVTRSSRR